jgi:hypothetical protein
VSAMLNPDQLVMEYLASLRVAVTGLPRADELVADVGARIADERATRPDDGPAQVQAFLDRLGNPYEIAAAAFRPPPVARPPVVRAMRPVPYLGPVRRPRGAGTSAEAVAVVALTAGAVLAPVIGPLVGAVTASSSPRWRPGEKLWAWLLVTSPLAVILLFLPALAMTGSEDLLGFVLGVAAVGAVVGPASAGGMLASRLVRPQPRHAVHQKAERRPFLPPVPRPPTMNPPYGRGPFPPRFDAGCAYSSRESGRSFPKGGRGGH